MCRGMMQLACGRRPTAHNDGMTTIRTSIATLVATLVLIATPIGVGADPGGVVEDDGRDALLIDGRPARLTTPEMLGGFGGMGKPIEVLAAACLSGRYAENAPAPATDPIARLALLDADGIDRALLYPSLGLQWEAE